MISLRSMPGPGGHRHVDHHRVAERGPVDVDPVAADRPGALEPGQPVSDRGRRTSRSARAERPLGLARVAGQRPQQRQVEVVDLDLRTSRPAATSARLGERR